MNPYYNPEDFGLEMISFDEDGLSYEFNTLCFWLTPDGQIYSASDSGCSCPTPFEGYEANDLKNLLPQLERVGSLEQAESIFDSWNNPYVGGRVCVDGQNKHDLSVWIKENLKN